MKPANDHDPRARPRDEDALPPVTLEVFVTLEEWVAIRRRHEELQPRRSAFFDAVGEVLGARVCKRMVGEVIGFRLLRLGVASPTFEERFAVPRSR